MVKGKDKKYEVHFRMETPFEPGPAGMSQYNALKQDENTSHSTRTPAHMPASISIAGNVRTTVTLRRALVTNVAVEK